MEHRNHNHKRNSILDEQSMNSILASPGTESNAFIIDEHGRGSDLYNFLKLYIDFGYYLCYIPFKIVKDPVTGFRLKENRIQQVVCALAHFMAIYRFISRLRKLNLEGIGHKSIAYFDLFGNAATILYQLTFVYTLWTKQKEFLEIVKHVESCTGLPKGKKVYRRAFMICLLYSIIAISHPLIGHEMFHSSSWSLNLFTTCYKEEAKFMYFLRGGIKMSLCQSAIENGTIRLSRASSSTGVEILLGTNLFIIHLYRYIAAFYVDLAVLMCTLTLWYPSSAFANYLRSSGCSPHDLNAVCEKYNQLKVLSTKIRAAIGTVLVAYYLEGILYYSSHLDKVIVTNDWFEKFRVFVFLVTLAMVLIYSGKTCKVVEESMYDWLSYENNGDRIPQYKLAVFLDELGRHTVGMSGNGLFTVSFVWAAHICSLVVTYFIITLEFKSVE